MSNTKIIALLPFKNEETFLPSYISSVKPIVDQIIAIDDGSTDASAKILKNAGAQVVSWEKEKMKFGWAELGIRQTLLEMGREAKGKYFVVLDADEAFTRPFIQLHKKILPQLQETQRIQMQWLAMWKSTNHFKEDHSVWSNNFKDFIFCDDGKIEYPKIWMHTPRTPGNFSNEDTDLRLNPKYGAVMHFQFSDWDAFQIKQAWLRMSELVKEPTNFNGINSKYQITLDDPNSVLVNIPNDWIADIEMPKIDYEKNLKDLWRMKKIEELFEEHGIEFFSKLHIWHIPTIVEVAKKYVK